MNSFTFRGAIFDLDGVITQTARTHFLAWKDTFEGFLNETGHDSDPSFTYEDDYIPYVDGKPRYDGVQGFLQSRGVQLPWGEPGDEPGNDTVCAVGNKKNDAFRAAVQKHGVEVYRSSLRLVHELKDRGIHVAVASSSKNTSYVLKSLGHYELFEAVVDGVVSAELGLAGKPAPDIFVTAAARMGLTPKSCMMVEDAYAGVEAGLNGNFAFVLGVNREGGPEGLYARGADLVVPDLEEVDWDRIQAWFRDGIRADSWALQYHGFKPDQERLREALTTVGNGYFGSRGAFPGAGIEDDVHYPGTYLSGLFNTAETDIEGTTVRNTDFVNAPNWLRVDVRVDGGEPLTPQSYPPVRWRHWIDLQDAAVYHDAIFRDQRGRETRVESVRFASMVAPHIGAMRYIVTPLNYSGPISVNSVIDGDVFNYGVERYRSLEQRHLGNGRPSSVGSDVRLETDTLESAITVGMQAHHHAFLRSPEGELIVARNGEDAAATEDPSGVARETMLQPSLAGERFELDAQQGTGFGIEKIVWISTNRDWEIEHEPIPTLGELRFEELFEAHRERWRSMWATADVLVRGDRFVQRAARAHAYHLLATASPHFTRMDAGLPARGVHGEAYRGHIFWDELFTAPFYARTFPEILRAHLMYRYRRLGAAREIAAEEGCAGALYPWQSADTGDRESQQLHYNPKSGDWDPDLSMLQRHISPAIAYNVRRYVEATGDADFLHDYGMEMLLELARFWADFVVLDQRDGRYHIDHSMGPDEFHERYPGADSADGGFRDNAYTNVMVAWLLDRVSTDYEALPPAVKMEYERRIAFDHREITRWREIVSRLALEMDDHGVLSQFVGYRQLEDLDWEFYREKYGDIRRMDRVLKAEGDSPDRYQVAKQADTLMLWYLLTPEEVARLVSLMGYPVDDPYDFLRRNYEYYIGRTSHGSTLSYVVHAEVLAKVPGHEEQAWRWFLESMKSDLYDTQGGTTLEGIHCGVMAGSLSTIERVFAGVAAEPGHVTIAPALPADWEQIAFRVQRGDTGYEIHAEPDAASARVLGEDSVFSLDTRLPRSG